MSRRCRSWLLALAAAGLTPGLAHGQGATAFDGTYAGVSRVLDQDLTPRHNCPPSGGLRPLTIAGGVARGSWGDGTLEGQVGPGGTLTLRAGNNAHFDGRIEPGGRITGRINSFVGGRGAHSIIGCSYNLTWQRRR